MKASTISLLKWQQGFGTRVDRAESLIKFHWPNEFIHSKFDHVLAFTFPHSRLVDASEEDIEFLSLTLPLFFSATPENFKCSDEKYVGRKL